MINHAFCLGYSHFRKPPYVFACFLHDYIKTWTTSTDGGILFWMPVSNIAGGKALGKPWARKFMGHRKIHGKTTVVSHLQLEVCWENHQTLSPEPETKFVSILPLPSHPKIQWNFNVQPETNMVIRFKSKQLVVQPLSGISHYIPVNWAMSNQLSGNLYVS